MTLGPQDSLTTTASPAISSDGPHSQRLRLQHRAVQLLALVIVIAAVLFCFFSDRRQSFDDLHLANISYMFAHYSELSYPAHWQYHTLTLHPPLHHLEIGLLMKARLGLYYAEAVAPFLFFVLGIYFVLSSPFPTVVRIGLLLAFCVPFLNIEFVPRPRPDLHRALATFAGLLALESGRLARWNIARLFWGSFLLTYAATLHYPGFLTWTGVAVYIAWVVLERGLRGSKTPIMAMVAGGLTVGVPFLLLFVIPNWHGIMAVIRDVDPMGGVGASFRVHFDVYRGIYSNPAAMVPLDTYWPTRIIFFPLIIKIPVILISTLILGLNRSTRGIALASLPYPLFLLLRVANHKIFWWGYFILEFMLYVAAVAILVCSIADWLGNRIRVKGWSWALAPAAGFAMLAGLLYSSPILRSTEITRAPRVHEDAVARAAARSVLGPGALVGSRNAIMWYAGGATYYHGVDSDVLWPKDPPRNLTEYFGAYDAVIEHQSASSVTSNREHKSLISWYSEGILNLRGFYFTSDVTLPYLMLSSRKTDHVEGFGLLANGEIAHFRQSDRGEYRLVTALCEQRPVPQMPSAPMFRNSFLLPEKPGLPNLEVESFMFRAQDYAAVRPSIFKSCRLRDEIPLSMESFHTRQLLSAVKNDQVVYLYEYYKDASDARWGPELRVEVSQNAWPAKLSFSRGAHKDETYALTTPGAQQLIWSDMETENGYIHAYSRKPSVHILADGLRAGDRYGSFVPVKDSDHLATNFEPLPATGPIFFSAWIKPASDELPHLSIQLEDYQVVGQAAPVVRRPDGWVLLAGFAEHPKDGRVRLLLEPKGHPLAFDKLLMVEVHREALAKKSTNPLR